MNARIAPARFRPSAAIEDATAEVRTQLIFAVHMHTGAVVTRDPIKAPEVRAVLLELLEESLGGGPMWQAIDAMVDLSHFPTFHGMDAAEVQETAKPVLDAVAAFVGEQTGQAQ